MYDDGHNKKVTRLLVVTMASVVDVRCFSVDMMVTFAINIFGRPYRAVRLVLFRYCYRNWKTGVIIPVLSMS